MSDYKQKYLKYKNKYFELKNKLNEQTGGNLYMDGTYVFFYNKDLIPGDLLTEGQKIIEDFNNFTNKLGNCALFFRIGYTRTGFDLSHSYDTIYPNKSTIAVGLTTAINATKTVGTTILNKATDLTKSIANVAENLNKKKSEENQTVVTNQKPEENPVVTNENEEEEEKNKNTNFTNSTGGNVTNTTHVCDFKSIQPVDEGGKNILPIKFIADLDDDKLKSIIKKVNSDTVKFTNVIIVTKKNKDAEINKQYNIDYKTENNEEIINFI